MTLGDIVTVHPELARELERRRLDYCCGGEETLAAAAERLGLDAEAIAGELAGVADDPTVPEWAALGPAELCDHLEATHHRYLDAELPRLGALMDKVLAVHSEHHPELDAVAASFAELRADLEPHLMKEERVLFPMVRELATSSGPTAFHCGSLRNPISVMLREHDMVGELLERLRRLTGDYTAPADGCASYRALYDGLAALESDTHQHVHKENNRLFPLVIELEDRSAVADGPQTSS